MPDHLSLAPLPWSPREIAPSGHSHTDGLAADGDTTFSQEIFDVSMAKIESVVQPDCAGNNVGRELVPFVGAHGPILPI